jgi:hypothetical protein
MFSYQASNLGSRCQQFGFVVFEPFLLSMRSCFFFHIFFLSVFLFANKHALTPSAFRKSESGPSMKSLAHYTENKRPNFDEYRIAMEEMNGKKILWTNSLG